MDKWEFPGYDCMTQAIADSMSEGRFADNPQKTRLTCVEPVKKAAARGDA